MGARLRRAYPEDVQGLLRLEQECFTDYYAAHRFDHEIFLSYLRRADTISYVAEEDDGLAGYIMGEVIDRMARRFARMDSLAVAPAARRRGLGLHLTDRFIDDARQRGCVAVRLEVATVNVTATRLFETRGFQKTRQLRRYYGNTVDGYRMCVDLRVQ